MDESGRTSCSKYGSGESNNGWLEQQGMLGDAGGIGEGHSNRFMNKIVQVSKVGVCTKPDLLIVCANSKMIYTYSVASSIVPMLSNPSIFTFCKQHMVETQGLATRLQCAIFYTCMRYLPTPIHLSPFLTAIRVSCTALDPGLLVERCVCVFVHACMCTCVCVRRGGFKLDA